MSVILLADDSPHAQRMGEHILREEGHTVTTAADAPTALSKLANADLIIADAFLPGSNGLDLCRQIKQKQPQVRVILTAGSNEMLDITGAKQAGCDGILRKPFEASEVIALIRPLLRDGAFPQAARIQDAVEAALLKALPSLTRDITEKVLLALETKNAR